MIRITNAKQAAGFLESLVLNEPRSYAERAAYAQQAVAELLKNVGNPQQQLSIIHITGSKGKGSTALLIEAILLAAGLRVGTFTSPHLQRWTERYRIDGEEVDGALFATTLETLRPHVEFLKQQQPENPPSFFDTATAAALLLFQQSGVDVAIIEVGIGGRLDATNVVMPAVTCITSVELEHTDKLGNTLAAIAQEKAGIIKPDIPVVVGRLSAEPMAVIVEKAQLQQAPVYVADEAFAGVLLRPGVFSYQSDRLHVETEFALLGAHMVQNAALAVFCIEQLQCFDKASLVAAVKKGLRSVSLPGRCEVLQRQPWIVVDGAHTVASLKALKAVLAELPVTKRLWLLSFAVHKNPCHLLEVLIEAGDKVILTQVDPVRSQTTQEIAALIDSDIFIDVIADPLVAVQRAYTDLIDCPENRDMLLCVTGSVYMAGLGRAVLQGLLAIKPPASDQD